MNATLLVTICVPVYRRGYPIHRTLDSVRNQTFKGFVVDIAVEPAKEVGETHFWYE